MRHLLTLTLLLALPLSVPSPAIAQDDAATAQEAPEGSYGSGFAIYQRYCRSCHGQKGQGDGHVAKYLKIPPTDLTRLAVENGGEFPTERALASIDGREEMSPLHGRDMPIWGSVFQADAGQTEADAQQKLRDLIAYLRGIQVEGGAETDAPQQE